MSVLGTAGVPVRGKRLLALKRPLTPSSPPYRLVCVTNQSVRLLMGHLMHDPTTSDALPTPDQMRNYFAAARAAWQTRRLRESSRAIITGNLAFAACLLGTLLVVVHSDWFTGAAPFVMCGVVFVYLACLVGSLCWMKRQRSRGSVRVIDRRQAESKKTPVHPVRR